MIKKSIFRKKFRRFLEIRMFQHCGALGKFDDFGSVIARHVSKIQLCHCCKTPKASCLLYGCSEGCRNCTLEISVLQSRIMMIMLQQFSSKLSVPKPLVLDSTVATKRLHSITVLSTTVPYSIANLNLLLPRCDDECE